MRKRYHRPIYLAHKMTFLVVQRQETNIQDVDHTVRELKIVQLHLQSSNVVLTITCIINILRWESDIGIPTSGSFTSLILYK